MKTLLLWLAGLGGLLIVVTVVSQVLSLLIGGSIRNRYVTWSDVEDLRNLWVQKVPTADATEGPPLEGERT